MTDDGPDSDGSDSTSESPGRTDPDVRDKSIAEVGVETTDIDSVTLEVVRNATAAVAEEMNATLVRTAYSPNIKERRDCSCALFARDGEMVSQAETIPVHLGAMPYSVAAAIEEFPPATLEAGDAILLNDPFAGGAHLPDLTLVTPVFHEDTPVAFAANRAHHADIGGAHGGSVAADSTEIYQEGLRIPPIKLYEAGEPKDGIFEMLLRNVRTPNERRGDLRAQHAANETGRRRFQEVIETHGIDRVMESLAAVREYSERRMRSQIRALPDGDYQFEDVIESDGRGNDDLPIRATVSIDTDELTVDFTGSAQQTAGPVNAVIAVTASATFYVVRCVTDPDIPPNAGCYRPVTIETPSGSIVNAEPPAAVVGGNLETSQRVTDVLFGAFAKAVPDRVAAAGQGTMNNVTFGGRDPRQTDDAGDTGGTERTETATASVGAGDTYTFYETQAGGFGGRRSGDGLDAVHVHMSNTRNTPIEVLETAYPLRVQRYELRPDSGGAGEYRGGLGLRRDVTVRGHRATFSLLAERHRTTPYGLEGGRSGEPGCAALIDDGNREPLPAKVTRELLADSTVRIETPGGGGYGNPADRDRMALRQDLREGKVTETALREEYGVDPDTLDPCSSVPGDQD